MKAPYYEHAGITIYHADCREIMPGLEPVDLLLTDPPYGIGMDGGVRRKRSRAIHDAEKKKHWDCGRPEREVFDLMRSLSRVSVIWGGNYFADMLPPTMGWLYWRKMTKYNFADGELAWTSREKALREFSITPQSMKKQHPTQKPLPLMQWCISTCAPDAKTILDPFVGSGTTLRAAKDAGIKAIGIETDEEYCEIAAKRLSQEVLF